MAKRKVTFTLDVETITRLRRASERMSKPQSAVVRDAIREYSARIGKLSEAERLTLLEHFDELLPRIPPRPLREVENELRAVRESRRTGGRRTGEKRRR